MTNNDYFTKAIENGSYLEAANLAISFGRGKASRSGAWWWANQAIWAAQMAGITLRPGNLSWPDFNQMENDLNAKPKKIFFGFAIADSMFPGHATVTRTPMSVDEVRAVISNAISVLNPSHVATIAAMRERYGLDIEIPTIAPRVVLESGDSIIVMSVRGLPRLDATRHEYTSEEIQRATFEFARWDVK